MSVFLLCVSSVCSGEVNSECLFSYSGDGEVSLGGVRAWKWCVRLVRLAVFTKARTRERTRVVAGHFTSLHFTSLVSLRLYCLFS